MHEGHREKMRERIARNGMDSLAEHEVLETLLYYILPREDTNPIAHRLISRFGSIAGVLEAPTQELLSVEGVGPKVAAFLSALPAYTRRYLVSRQKSNIALNSPEKLGDYLAPFFVGMQEELVMVLCLDNCCRVLACRTVHHGSVNAVEVNLRGIVQMALENNAAGVVLAHNHPGGFAAPSSEDLETTRSLRDTLAPLRISLVDHLILAPPTGRTNLLCDYISLAANGYLEILSAPIRMKGEDTPPKSTKKSKRGEHKVAQQ